MNRRRGLTAGAVLLAACGVALAAGPQVRFVTVTDVTPRSFELVWLSNEPTTGTLRLFEAPDCVTEILRAEITPYPLLNASEAIANAARQKGNLAVRAANLAPDTEYCVQTVTESSVTHQVTTYPSTPLRVRTERRTTRARTDGSGIPVAFGNDLARIEIARTDPAASTAGALVLVKVRGASSPLAGFVGDGITDATIENGPTGLALVDLNNLYAAGTGESMPLLGNGTEEISVRVLGGPQGFVTVEARVVPPTRGFCELLTPAVCALSAPAVCDGRLGDADGDGELTRADAAAVRDWVVGAPSALVCRACADVTWDFTLDMKDALAAAQAAAILRALPW